MMEIYKYFDKYLATTIEQSINAALASVYVCAICGRVVKPTVSVSDNGVIITSEATNLRGGLGNKTLASPVCSECANKMEVL